MKPLLFVTGNAVKFRTASTICSQLGVQLKQISMDIPEIQAHDGETVARDKALRIFEEFQKPLIISDDTWMITGLKNFPGPYMKFVNEVFTAEDWLRLTGQLTDRRIILRQYVVYQDKHRQQLFHSDLEGVLLKEIRGEGPYPHTSITSFDGGKTTIAETIEQNKSAVAAAGQRTSWHDFCEWYLAQTSPAE
jgi:XTP/dITP diphosphohydrolase